MKGQRYVPTDFGGPATTSADTVATHGETRIIRAEPAIDRAPETVTEPAPSYVARQPAKRNNALMIAAPIALAALVGGALLAANTNDDADRTETVAAADDADQVTTTTTTTTAAAEPADADRVQVAAAAPAVTPAPRAPTPASPAPVARVQRAARTAVARATPPAAPVASSAGDAGVDVSGAGAVDLTSEAAGSGELPAGPQPYTAASPASPVQESAPVGVESAPVEATPPVVSETTTPVAP